MFNPLKRVRISGYFWVPDSGAATKAIGIANHRLHLIHSYDFLYEQHECSRIYSEFGRLRTLAILLVAFLR